MHRVAWMGLLASAASMIACSAGSDGASSEFDPGTGDGGHNAAGSSSSGLLVAGSSTGSGPSHDCAEETKLVYVVSEERGFYSFKPDTLTLTKVGTLECPTGGSPFSMAVDRNGVAWVLYDGGRIFHVDILTAACTATSFVGSGAFSKFGMGFATNSADSTAETLFLGAFNGSALGKLDTTTLQLTSIGPYDQLHGAAELTGTGDGRLFGFFEAGTVHTAQIDENTAALTNVVTQSSVKIGTGWAWAFWGGSFWMFTNPSGFGSKITNYDPVTGDTKIVLGDVGGFNIVGAGVSTCAPVDPPH